MPIGPICDRRGASGASSKNVYVALRSGWFSGRSAVYLALGKPVVVQDTGWSKYYPTGAGLFGFETAEEAVAALETANADYRRHCDAARAVRRKRLRRRQGAGASARRLRPRVSPVFVGSAFVAKYPTGGGNFWVPLQYVLGLRALGVEAYWLELLWPQADVARARRFLSAFQRHVEALGVADWVTVVFFPDNERDDPPGREESFGAAAQDLWTRARAGLLLNLAHSVPASLRGRFARTALFDIDPGPFQLWARDNDLGVGSHDAYLTIGQNLGAPDCPVPLGDVPWQRVWPAVHLPAWPAQPAIQAARYTTVTQWWSDAWTVLGSEVIEGHKRTSFLRVLELPRQVPVPLELAANIHPEETEDQDNFSPARAGTSRIPRW